MWESGHWTGAYFNFPAFLIIFLLTVLLVRGIRESAQTNNVMVAVKIGAILTFLVVGGMLVNHAQLGAVCAIWLWRNCDRRRDRILHIHRFDSVSTAAEESKNPQRDYAHWIIGSLIVCTVLYIGVSIVLLGMMKYTTFVSGEAADSPVAYALKHLGANRFAGSAIVIGALMGMISSLLVFQYGQARIWYAMSRDGLFPKLFSKVHPRFQDAVLFYLGRRVCSRDSGGNFRGQRRRRSFQHRHPVRVRPGFAGRDLVAARISRTENAAFACRLCQWFPLISIMLCGGLMTGLTVITWIRFVVWLVLGLIVYFVYSANTASSRRETSGGDN